MAAAVPVPVSVKCRIGIDDSAEYEFLARFVATVAAASCRTFVVHARKAWLRGLSPKENREIPPLRYELVHRLKRECPALRIVINGGLRRPAEAGRQLGFVDGVMIGREAYENPWSLIAFQAALQGQEPSIARTDAVEMMAGYAQAQMARGVPLRSVARHMLGLFNGLPGARAWRRRLAAVGPNDRVAVLREAAALVATQRPLAA
jgi:tRNA-dihydrouridine synthase A